MRVDLILVIGFAGVILVVLCNYLVSRRIANTLVSIQYDLAYLREKLMVEGFK